MSIVNSVPGFEPTTHSSHNHLTRAPDATQWGTAASTFVYFTQLLPSGGAFLAEMAGQQIGLNGSAKKLVQKRPVGGTKCVK